MRKKQKEEISQTCRFPEVIIDEDGEAHTYTMSDITWRIFRIMSEFVEGFQFLSKSCNEVAVFGSARMPEGTHWNTETTRMTKMLGEAGFTIITGGGPGLMEAANKGAFESGAPSLGLNIQLPEEQRINPYVTRSRAFHYFFTRKVMLTASGQAYIFCPGGFGTMDEFFEIITLIQTGKMAKVPVVCLGHEYWDGLHDWIKETMRDKLKTISKGDEDLFQIVDTAEEVLEIVKKSEERSFF